MGGRLCRSALAHGGDATPVSARLARYQAAAGAGAGAGGGGGAEPSDADVVSLTPAHGGEPIFDVCTVKSDDSGAFLTCGDDKSIAHYQWRQSDPSAPTLKYQWRGHERCVNKVAVRADKAMVASASRDLSVRLWHWDAPEPVATLKGHTLTVSAVDFSPDSTLLCSGSRDTSLRLWDVAGGGGRQIARAEAPRNLVTCLKWFPGDQRLVAQGSEDLHVRIWDTRTPSVMKLSSTLAGYVYFPLALDVSADGNYLLTSSKGFNSVGCEGKLWDLRTRQVVTEYTGHEQDTVACKFLPQLHPGAKPMVATASKDRSIRLWDRDDGTCVLKHVEPEAGPFTALDVFPMGSGAAFVASTFSSMVRVYDVMDSMALTVVAQAE